MPGSLAVLRLHALLAAVAGSAFITSCPWDARGPARVLGGTGEVGHVLSWLSPWTSGCLQHHLYNDTSTGLNRSNRSGILLRCTAATLDGQKQKQTHQGIVPQLFCQASGLIKHAEVVYKPFATKRA
jgi:hypothetical protein